MCANSYPMDSISYSQFRPQTFCAGVAPNMPFASCAGYDPLSLYGSIYGTGCDLASSVAFRGGYGDYTSGIANLGYSDYAPSIASGINADGFAGAYTGGYAYDPESMYKMMDKWTDYMYDRNVKYTEKARANDLRLNGPVEATQYAVDSLKEKIIKDDHPQMQEAWAKYLETLKNIYPEYAELDAKSLNAKALELYKQRNNNVALKDDIRAAGHGMFTQKFLNGVTLGLGWSGSAEDTIAKISGTPMSREDELKGTAGSIAGYATSIGGTTLLAKQMIKNPAKVTKFVGKNWLGLAIAGVAAAIGFTVARD